MKKSFNWHNPNKTTYIYCSDDDWDWDSDNEYSKYDWGNVIFDDDSNSWLSWWTSKNNFMVYSEGEYYTLEEAKQHIEETREN